MININSYKVTERAVFAGVSVGVERLLKDVQSFSNPDEVITVIGKAVLEELMDVYDFGVQQVRFTPDMLLKIMAASEPVTDPNKTSQASDGPAQ